MKIREITETIEQNNLSPFACFSKNTKGRQIKEARCDIRTDFQRDRDRIIHSKAFRRLKHKTQVFISPEGDHYRTRLTHTLEVAQIARTIARALRLNEDLTETIALGHDLGHTPFGHAGEQVLNEIHQEGFKHNEQSLRVVDLLEGGKGLNLTWEVRDGILKHTGDLLPDTLEGRIVRQSDRIAYINHDIDDALRGGIIDIYKIPQNCLMLLGNTHKARIHTMIVDIINESSGKNDILMSEPIKNAMDTLRTFMFDTVYIGSKAKVEEKKAQDIIRMLYHHFVDNPEFLPVESRKKLENTEIKRVVCDYIAGMTDRYAMTTFKNVFLPFSWQE